MKIAVFWDVTPHGLIDRYQTSEERADLICSKA